MIKGSATELQDIAVNNVCAEHHTRLEVVWAGDLDIHVLRCQHGERPEKIERILGLAEEHRAGETLPSPIVDSIKRGQKHAAKSDGADMAWGELVMVPRRDLATGEVLDIKVVQALCDYAGKYGLDPGRGHVVMMYGHPYITIDGYLYHARQTKEVYKLVSCPLAAEEYKAYLVPDGAHAWLSTVIKADGNMTFTGLGIVLAGEMTEMSKKHPDQLRSPVVARHPWQLAQKRAEWQALRRAFPIGETEEAKGES